jgi:hypothetical protein
MTKIYHWINSKLNRDRKNTRKVMKYNLKNILMWEGPNTSSISELIGNKSKNLNVSLFLILVSYKNLKNFSLKIANIQGS